MAKKYAPTPEQRDVIDITDRTILLSAAAGSGKTATLTERLITMITRKEDPLDVTRMLVVTFTRAAAEELRTRIAAALTEAVLAHPDDERLAKQLLLLPTARIRTIDAFCNDLVKGHTAALGISPLYRIADESEVDILGISLLDDLIEDAYDGTFAPEGLDIASVVEVAESVKSQGTLAEELYKLYKTSLHGQKDGVSLLSHHAEALSREANLPFFDSRAGKALKEHYLALFAHQKSLLEKTKQAIVDKEGEENVILKTLLPKYTYLCEFFDSLAAACHISYKALTNTAKTYAPPRAKNCPNGHTYLPEETRFKTCLSDVGKDLQKFMEKLAWEREDFAYAFRTTAHITRSVYLLLRELDEKLSAEKKRRAIFDYDDITGFAYRLLCTEKNEPTPLALEFKSAFDAVCIDEYQDVNAVQHRIFELISTERNRFMVGDIKQSIYAFRGAVPDIFGELRSAFPPKEANASSAVLYLTKNFRSEEPVITFANGVFDFLFPVVGGSIGYREKDRLSTFKTRDEKHLLPTVSLLLRGEKEDEDPERDKKEEDDGTKSEDERIAECILLLLKEGKLHDGSPIRPSDIAILTREYPYALIETLRAHKIPLRTKDKTDFFSRKEILLALSLCHAVNNPNRDIYLGGLLRSPLYGFTLDEMIKIRAAKEEGSFFTALCAYAEANPQNAKTARVIEDLTRFRELAKNMPSHRLIRMMFDEVGIYAVTDSAGRTALRAFYELARSYEANAFRGLYRFLDRITEIRKYGYGLPAEEVGEEEAVTVSTIHASKGLEYPVCILAHTGKNLKKANRSPFLFSKEQGLTFEIPDKTGCALLKTPLSTALTVQKTMREIEEAVRVLYVALTRPKEQLYIFCSHATKRTEKLENEAKLLQLAPSPTALYTYASYAHWILASLDRMPNDHRLVKIASTDTEEAILLPQKEAECAAKKENEDTQNVALLREKYRERFSFRYPYEAETRLSAKLSVSELRPDMLDDAVKDMPLLTQEDYTPTTPVFLSGKEENMAAKAGTATHLFMQFCDFSSVLTTIGYQKEVIDTELSRLVSHGFMSQEDVALVRKKELYAFLSSDLAEEIKGAKELHREFRFHVSLPAENFTRTKKELYRGADLFLQGVADLLILRADGSLLLVDYKTDRIPHDLSDKEASELLFSRHSTQLTAYAGALAEIFGTAPDIAIYSLPRAKMFKNS